MNEPPGRVPTAAPPSVRRLAGLPALLDSVQADDTVAAAVSPSSRTPCSTASCRSARARARPRPTVVATGDSRRRRGGDPRGGTGAGAPRRRSECLRPRRALEHLAATALGTRRTAAKVATRHPRAAARPRPSGQAAGRSTSSGACATTAAGSTAEASRRAPTARPRRCSRQRFGRASTTWSLSRGARVGDERGAEVMRGKLTY